MTIYVVTIENKHGHKHLAGNVIFPNNSAAEACKVKLEKAYGEAGIVVVHEIVL